ncbi:TetR family transcriptional regulator [Nocardia neocaledoniensis]|uniref:TetR family transcriptional regulator n=1 Tax=Nocardia neocaledoniensis TaxID=236511 RepID=UPI0024558314|nr:TetR family transcriptional regulator [Nocardia neocaledoniensis]
MSAGHGIEAADEQRARPPRRRRDPEKTREAIIDGLLAAIADGDFAPTARTIAARAGASERSVFVHFPDREALLVAAVERQSEMVEACLVEPDPGLPLAARIALAARQSRAIFDLQRTPRLPGLQESRTVAAIDPRGRPPPGPQPPPPRPRRPPPPPPTPATLAALFAPELAGDDELLDLVDAALAWPARHHLQDRRGHSGEAATAAIERALRLLLA